MSTIEKPAPDVLSTMIMHPLPVCAMPTFLKHIKNKSKSCERVLLANYDVFNGKTSSRNRVVSLIIVRHFQNAKSDAEVFETNELKIANIHCCF